jgi:hypothetical protein
MLIQIRPELLIILGSQLIDTVLFHTPVSLATTAQFLNEYQESFLITRLAHNKEKTRPSSLTPTGTIEGTGICVIVNRDSDNR